MKDLKQSPSKGNKGTWVGARFDANTMERLEAVQASYRSPNKSHTIRLLVDDAFYKMFPKGEANAGSV